MKGIVRLLVWVVIGGVALGLGWKWWKDQQTAALPEGIVSGNGRIESIQVDIAAKYGGRVKELFAKEGDLVDADKVLVIIDTDELQAELDTAKAKLAEAEENKAEVSADIVKQEGELKLAEQNLERAKALVAKRTISKEEFDEKQTARDSAAAALNSVKAKLRSVTQSGEAAAAEVKRIHTRIDDSTLKSPVRGRVLYRLAEVGEVLAAGGKAMTLINLGDIYMEIFLPGQDAARCTIGSDARITLDARPGYVAGAKVSFVSPEAQFTPKQVETRSERDKLMFRVKLQVPEETLRPYLERIKTGVRGVGYVRLDNSVPWPASLEERLPPAPENGPKSP
ncbi:MAG TPA: HlyD family efflux transporter periplasmic adaptor subunit [Pirellulales bacterium]|nr:HlyD family efflux transporter periplasmic adaptor subunit [Pirellulales bacterium]